MLRFASVITPFTRSRTFKLVSCYKLTAEQAERAGMLWARQWIDTKGD